MQPPAWVQRVIALPFTVTLVVLIGVAELDYAVLPAHTSNRLAAWASTNVDRLLAEPFLPMLVSPFVVLENHLAWLALIAIGGAVVESRYRWRRTLLVVLLAHILGTLVSEGIVWWRERHGRLPVAALHQLDVGPSYIAVGLLAAAVVGGRGVLLRLLAAAALVVAGPGLVDGLGRLEVAAVGHVTAAAIGGIAGVVFVVREGTRLRIGQYRPIHSS